MTKVKTLFTQSVSLLQNTLSPKESVEYLLGFVLQCNPKDVYLYFEQKLSEEKKNVLQNLVQRRMYKEPVPYILNRTSFYQLDFYVDTSVLIPRVETELLVDLIIQKIQHQDLSQKVLWDIGTGSGCIGISLSC
jgi:release factor glutamine methyltransferase